MTTATRISSGVVLPNVDPGPSRATTLKNHARPRDLREVIPAGKGRVDTAEYLARIRRGQLCGMQSLLKLVNYELSPDWKNPAVLCIVGGGPSLADEVGALRRLIKRGAKVLAVNKSHDWLLARRLRCDYAALLDRKEWVAGYIDLNLAGGKPTRRRAGKYWSAPKYLVASQCHDDVLAKFKGRLQKLKVSGIHRH